MAQLTGIQRIFETGMIVCTVLALFIFLSLMSFHQADPGWTQTGLQPTIQNWMGPAGAKLADLLFFSLGYLAYSLPFLFALIGWLAFQQVKQLLDLDFLNIGLRLIGVIFIAIGVSGLASINFDDMYYFSAGGLFGDVISSALLPQFNFVGTTVLLLSFFATGFTLASGISWLSVVDLIGASTLWAGKKAIALPQGVGQLSLPSPKFLSAQKDTDDSDDISISTLRPTEPAADDRPFNIKHETLYKVPEDILDGEPEILINVDTMSSDISLGSITPEITIDYDTQAQVEPVMDAAVVSSPLVKSVMKHKHVEKPEGERPSFALLDRADKVKNPITKEELEGISRLNSLTLIFQRKWEGAILALLLLGLS